MKLLTQLMAFLLVSYRVLLGRAWTPKTGRQLSTMRWNHDHPEDDTNTTAPMDEVPKMPGSRMVAGENGLLA
jgi:hypothetical protein